MHIVLTVSRKRRASIPGLRSALLYQFDVDRDRHVVADHPSAVVHLGVPFHAEILPVDLGGGVRRGSLVAPRIFHRRRRPFHVQHDLLGDAVNGQVPGHFQFAGLYLLHLGRLKRKCRGFFALKKSSLRKSLSRSGTPITTQTASIVTSPHTPLLPFSPN